MTVTVTNVTNVRMDNIHQIIRRVEQYATERGMRPDLVCRRATGNPYLLERLLRRSAQTEIDIARLQAFIDAEAQCQNGPDQPADQATQKGSKRSAK